MSLFKKFAEDLEDEYEQSDSYTAAAAEDDASTEVADEVEDKMDKEVEAVVAFLQKKKASKALVQYVIRKANQNGILISPTGQYARRSAASEKLTKAEQQFGNKVVEALVKATEGILSVAAMKLRRQKATRRVAKQVDKKLLSDGYLRCCIASPIPDKVEKKEKIALKAGRR